MEAVILSGLQAAKLSGRHGFEPALSEAEACR